MPYLYRYIDLKKEEVVYVGIVTTDERKFGYQACSTPSAMEYLERRNIQHRSDEWYQKIGEDNILLQYIFFESSIDARISELWLINFYDTGQLANKDGTKASNSELDLYSFIFGKWRNYGESSWNNEEKIRKMVINLVEALMRDTECLYVNIDSGIENMNRKIMDIRNDLVKAKRITRYEKQSDFKRFVKTDHEVNKNAD